MSRHTIAIVAGAWLVALFGCTATVTREGLMRRAARYDLTSWPDITYYCGSRAGFDYFTFESCGPTTWKHGRELRVAAAEGCVTESFDYTTDRRQWRVFRGVFVNPANPQSQVALTNYSNRAATCLRVVP